MTDDSDQEHIDEKEHKEEEQISEQEKRIFINHIDSYHGKNIARVS